MIGTRFGDRHSAYGIDHSRALRRDGSFCDRIIFAMAHGSIRVPALTIMAIAMSLRRMVAGGVVVMTARVHCMRLSGSGLCIGGPPRRIGQESLAARA